MCVFTTVSMQERHEMNTYSCAACQGSLLALIECTSVPCEMHDGALGLQVDALQTPIYAWDTMASSIMHADLEG